MKKLLGSTLALALLFPYGQANAELLKNFKLSGQIDVQATSARNVTDFATRAKPVTPAAAAAANNNRIGDAQTRLMLHMDWDLLDDVHSKVTIRKNDRNWGTAGGVNANTNGNSQPFNGDGGGGIDNTLRVDQANFKIDKLGGEVDATFGRQFYGESGDMVIYYGPSDKALYGLPTTSIDAARADWSNDTVGLTVLVGKVTAVATGVGVAAQGATDLRGINAALKGKEDISASAYIWNLVTHNAGALGSNPSAAGAAGGKNDFLYVAGVKGKFKAGDAWVSGEFAKNFGQNRVGAVSATTTPLEARNYSGWAFQLNGGIKSEVGGVGAISPWAHFGYGTGGGDVKSAQNRNFTAISPDYRPGGIYGRFAVAAGGASIGSGLLANGGTIASNTLSNRVIWGVGVKVTPEAMNKLTAGVSVWDYKFQKAISAPNTGGVAGGQRHIGSELDVDLEWKHSENVSLMAGVGTFRPGGYIYESNQATSGVMNGAVGGAGSGQPTNPATLAYMDVRVKF